MGNYQIRLGQGMILWQGFGATGDIGWSILKKSNLLSAYASSGESNYMQGFAIQKWSKKWETLLFVNHQKLDATLEGEEIKTIVKDGLHQTENDLQKMNNIQWSTLGASIKYQDHQKVLQWSGLSHIFSSPFYYDERIDKIPQNI